MLVRRGDRLPYIVHKLTGGTFKSKREPYAWEIPYKKIRLCEQIARGSFG